MSCRVHRSWLTLMLALSLLFPDASAAKVMAPDYDPARNKMIAYMLSRHLPDQHFSHKPMDDKLSRAAFDLYLKQLDPRKRFIRQEDVRELRAFETLVDDELRSGELRLAERGAELLAERIDAVEKMVDDLMKGSFDLDRRETLEVDPKKFDFARDDRELRDHWRRLLKMQVIVDYLDLMEEEEAEAREKAKASGQPLPESDRSTSVDKALLDKARDKAHKRFTNNFHRLRQETLQDHLDRFYNTVAQAYDPHTEYMPPTSKEDFDIHMRGSLEGIGALLREEDGYIKVMRIIPGSAAERQGQLEAEDIILMVAETSGEPLDVSDMRLRDAVTHIRGPKGSKVRLTVRKPDGLKKVISIVRDVVNIEETYVKGAVIEKKGGIRIGYLRIPSFYRDFSDHGGRNVTDDVRSELDTFKAKKVHGLVIDLRNNGGGSLGDVVDISGLFIPQGPIVQVKDAQGEIDVLEDPDPSVIYSGPIIVLVNKFSASASEILAAALQDYRRALIVGGKSTHGKGTVQAILDMNRYIPVLHLRRYDDLGALKVTIQKFYRVSGDSTQYNGVTPDVVLPDVLEHLDSGEKSLDYSLPWDQIVGAAYSPMPALGLDVEAVRGASASRVATDEKFQEIVRESERIMERNEESMTPIDLASMRALRAEEKALSANGTSLDEVTEQVLGNGKKPKKSLEEEIDEDPYVQEALRLLSRFKGQDLAREELRGRSAIFFL